MVEGETTAGYFCQLMVNPQEVARIFVDYDYALYRVLGEDAPDICLECGVKEALVAFNQSLS